MSRVSPEGFDSNNASFSQLVEHITNRCSTADVRRVQELLADLEAATTDRLRAHVRDKIRALAASADWRREFTPGGKEANKTSDRKNLELD